MANHEPVCIALLLCDQVIEDRTTNNKSFIGTFNQIQVTGVPSIHPRFSVVVSVTDGLGPKHPLKVQILRTDEDHGEVCDFQVNANLNLKDPLEVTDVIFNVVNFPIKSVGPYLIRVTLGESKALYQRAFRVIQRTPNVSPEPPHRTRD